MPSQLHEDLFDTVRSFFSRFMAENGLDLPWNGIQVEGGLLELQFRNPRPDCIISLSDDGGPIVVEIGNMKPGKWDFLTATDGRPVRVMRVHFDKTVVMLNPRETELELALVQFYREVLMGKKKSGDNIVKMVRPIEKWTDIIYSPYNAWEEIERLRQAARIHNFCEATPTDRQQVLLLTNMGEWRLMYWDAKLDGPLVEAGYYLAWRALPTADETRAAMRAARESLQKEDAECGVTVPTTTDSTPEASSA